MRLNYPTNIRIVKVPCTGRVAIIHLMKALENGADGVFVAGCLEGDCHYQVGNIRARKRVGYVKNMLEKIGVEPDRVAMYNLSAGMGPRFAEIAKEMTERIRELGPLRKGNAGEAARQVQATGPVTSPPTGSPGKEMAA
jgi:F420-non-reducing hydrogenase iron-sulfur subunit